MNGGWTGVDAVLVDNLAVPEEIGRPHGPAELPPGHGERLPGAPDGDGPLPHVRKCGHTDHLAAFENLNKNNFDVFSSSFFILSNYHMLIDVIGDAEDIVLLAEVGDHLDLLPVVDLAQWVVRVVEDDGLRLVVEHGLELVPVQLPIG